MSGNPRQGFSSGPDAEPDPDPEPDPDQEPDPDPEPDPNPEPDANPEPEPMATGLSEPELSTWNQIHYQTHIQNQSPP